MESVLEQYCPLLYQAGCEKCGQFTFNSGRTSNHPINLRSLISHPHLTTYITNEIIRIISTKRINFETICGVPYTTLPISTVLAVKLDKQIILRKKEPTSYSTKFIEGKFKEGDRCLVINDVLAAARDILETIRDIEAFGLVVKDVIVVVDGEDGTVQRLKERGMEVHSLLSYSQITRILIKNELLSSKLVDKIKITRKRLSLPALTGIPEDVIQRTKLSFEERMQYSKSEAASKLFSIMVEKQTNICVAADVSQIDKLLVLADKLGPFICIFKIHLDIIECYSEKDREELKQLAVQHNFLIMEDRKMADFGNTVRMQFNQLSKWATLVTAHSISGPGILGAIKSAEGYSTNVGVFLIAEPSCKNFITPDYKQKTAELAERYPQMVAGLVSQTEASTNLGMIQLTSLGNLEEGVQRPETIILENGADIVVVGSDIINNPNPVKAAKVYKKKLWSIYLSRVSQ